MGVPVLQGVHINRVLPQHTCNTSTVNPNPYHIQKNFPNKRTCKIHWPDGQESWHIEHTLFCHWRQAALSHQTVAPGTTTHGAKQAWQ